jgi:RNA polymerase sigma factor (sigma-70 family)
MRSVGADPSDENPGQAVAGPEARLVPPMRTPAVPAIQALRYPTRESGSSHPSSDPGSLGESTLELTARARSGDQVALELLCLRCLKSLSRYAAGRLPPAVRDMLDTQDVVLEAVQRGMSRLGDFECRHPGALRAYMRTILRNLIIDHVRSRRRHPQQVLLDDRQVDPAQSPLERVLDREQIELYEAALAHLRPRDAALVTLKIEEQLGHTEIAMELGFASANAARVATRRAVLRLAYEMSRLSREKSGEGPDGDERPEETGP